MRITLAILSTLFAFIPPVVAQQQQPGTGPFRNGVVAADHPLASQAGLEMLQAGGNCVDAAVATSFALSVVRPASCGIGGGGFMIIWNAEKQEAVALDYRERAPSAASGDMYQQKTKHETASMRGPNAVGVPGTVAGLCYAAEHYGSLPLKKLLEPAIRLARQGVKLDPGEIAKRQATLAKFKKYEGYDKTYELLRTQYLTPKDPNRFYSPQLPALELIAREGPDAFYRGEIAKAIVEACEPDGILTAADLANQNPLVVRKPLQGTFDGKQVLTMPPPSSGGVALLQMLNVLTEWEALDDKNSLNEAGHNSAGYIHVLTEAMKHAFADRAEFLGDMDFADVPIQRLLSRDYAKQIASRIDPDKTLSPQEYGRFFSAGDSGTSHLSVIDKEGNAVACTETINLVFGSFVVVPRFGFILNDEMDDFAARPGEPNAFGLIQSAANAVAPKKKPLSSMTPTLIIEDGKAIGAIGASGGPRIITATFQVLLNQVRFGLKPQDAVGQPRLHHQWSPNELRLEPKLFKNHSASLQLLGHKSQETSELAVSQSVARLKGLLYGGSDLRKYGQPAGY